MPCPALGTGATFDRQHNNPEGHGRGRVSLTRSRPALIAAAKCAPQLNGAQRDTWKVSVRYTVRGHFRNQAHGPSRALRKRIWLAPYWKGPLEGAKLSHLYTST